MSTNLGTALIVQDTTEPITATGEVGNSKTGKACVVNVLGLIAVGDQSIQTAITNGGITKVSTVDSSAFNFLSAIAKRCTIVTGE